MLKWKRKERREKEAACKFTTSLCIRTKKLYERNTKKIEKFDEIDKYVNATTEKEDRP